ncbi:MAG: ATP-dependent helicase C-terminal domain-containing protein, partial [Verrucomicrobiia bacterium]
ARELGVVELACVAAGVTQGRPVLLGRKEKHLEQARERRWGDGHGTDLAWPMLGAMEAEGHGFEGSFCESLGIHAGAARMAMAVARQLAGLMGVSSGEKRFGEEDWQRFRRCVMAGFADRVARRLDRGTLRCALVHGRMGSLERESRIRDEVWLVATEVREVRGVDGRPEVILGGASAVEEAWLREDQPDGWGREVRTELDAIQRVVVRRERELFRGIVVAERVRPCEDDPEAMARILAEEVLAGRCRLEQWNHEAEQWIVRINRVAEWCPELGIPPVTEGDRRAMVEQICYGARGPKEVRERPVLPVIRGWLSAEQLGAVEALAPVRLPLPSGRQVKVTYRVDQPPVVSARIQDFYGLDGSLAVAGGRVPVTLELLAPNLRPVQVTTDLQRFWTETYPKLRVELQRRYPKHEWR